MAMVHFRSFIRALYTWNLSHSNRKKRVGLDSADCVHSHLFYFYPSLCLLLHIADHRVLKRIIQRPHVHKGEFDRENHGFICFTCCCHLFMV